MTKDRSIMFCQQQWYNKEIPGGESKQTDLLYIKEGLFTNIYDM